MMSFTRSHLAIALLLLTASNLYARSPKQGLTFNAPIQASAIINSPAPLLSSEANSAAAPKQTLTVMLMNIPFTAEQKHTLQTAKSTSQHAAFSMTDAPGNLPEKVELGMNNVPVLDQGRHGSCVTFATVGALDALYAKGDYISPLCSLELGSYLENKSYTPSGWNGSFGSLVLARLNEFGVITMAGQKSGVCAGVKDYPVNDQANEGKTLSLDDYASWSMPISYDLHWFSIVTFDERFSPSMQSSDAMEKVLTEVKTRLASSDAKNNLRITFGTAIPYQYCSVGACAKFHATYDTWALTNAMRNDNQMALAGHEMIITGYDDNAIATDNEGAQHKGLLTLRNSWSDRAGDQGNYYMTYDFFKQYAIEVHVIRRNYP